MLEKKIFPKIIAVNPGWRYLAVAVFDKHGLREWRLKSLAAKGVKMKLKKAVEILDCFIERYNPEVLTVKRFHPSRSSVNLETIAAGISAYCQTKKIAMFSYSIKELEKIVLDSDRANRKEMIKALIPCYPELSREFRREEQNRNPYFVRLFEAVALGHVFLKALNNKH